MKHFTILMQFLRSRNEFIEEINQDINIDKKNISLLISSSIFFSIYGAIMGSLGSFLQILSSAIKLPALYLLTMVICLPTLFFFDVTNGSKRKFSHYLAILLAAMAVISVMLFAFAPVSLFFRLSLNDYYFFKLINVAILAITGFMGVNFFYKTMLIMTKEDFQDRSYHNKMLKAWLLLYALVGSQLGWTLRPFFGDIGEFQLFRPIEGNFYQAIFQLILKALQLQ